LRHVPGDGMGGIDRTFFAGGNRDIYAVGIATGGKKQITQWNTGGKSVFSKKKERILAVSAA